MMRMKMMPLHNNMGNNTTNSRTRFFKGMLLHLLVWLVVVVSTVRAFSPLATTRTRTTTSISIHRHNRRPSSSSSSSQSPSYVFIRQAAERQDDTTGTTTTTATTTKTPRLLSAAPLPTGTGSSSPPPILPIDVVEAMPPPLNDNDNKNAPDASNNNMTSFYLLRHGQSTSNVQGIISSDRHLAYSETHGLTELGIQQAQSAAEPLLDLIQESSSFVSKSPSLSSHNKQNSKNNMLLFVSSPFARAYQTAQACYQALDSNRLKAMNITLMNSAAGNDDSFSDDSNNVNNNIRIHDNLVERHFGRLDGDELFTYAYVWPLDRFNVTHTAFEVESVAAVCHRLRTCITELRNELLLSLSLQEQEQQTDASDCHYHVVLVSHADVLQIAQLYAAHVDNVGEFSSFRFTNGEVRRMHIGTGHAHLPPPAPLPRPVRGTFIA